MKLSKDTKNFVKYDEELIQQIIYELDNRWDFEDKFNMALAIFMKRKDDLCLVDNET